MRFSPGEEVNIPCTIQPGAFPNERLITIKTDDAELTGFVNVERLIQSGLTHGFIVGRIVYQDKHSMMIQMPASFFTTASGRTSVNSGWATHNLQAATG